MATLSHTSTKYRTLSRAVAGTFNVASMLIELDMDERPHNDARTLAFRLVREMVGEEHAQEIGAQLWAYLLGGGEDLDADTIRTVHEKVLAEIAEARAEAGECRGHPAGPYDPMGQTVYCDGSCRR